MGSVRRSAPAVAALAVAVAIGVTVMRAGDGDRDGSGDVGGDTAATPRPAAAAPSPAPAPTRSRRRFTLALAGDVLTHGPVNDSAAEAGKATGLAYDFAPLFAPLRPVVATADLALCHLEVPVAPDGEAPSGYPVFGAPRALVAGLASTGYDGCSTASNHSLDQGFGGVAATLDAMDEAGLGHDGTARDRDEAVAPAIYDVRGVSVAHLSYTYGFNGIPLPPEAPWAANRLDPDRVLRDASAARQAGADFVVVSLHWGDEYRAEPSAEQRRLAPVLIASPAVDLIVGHHAHVVQPIERVGEEFVVFGTGNQLSNQRQPERRDGLMVVALVAEGPQGRFAVDGIRCVPTWVDLDGHRVLLVEEAMSDTATPPARRVELLESFDRTVSTAGSCSRGDADPETSAERTGPGADPQTPAVPADVET